MPLTQNQIEKLKSIPNRVKIFGEATEEQKNLIDNDNRITPTEQQYLDDSIGKNSSFSLNILDFLKDNYEQFKESPLSVIHNDLLQPSAKLKFKPWVSNAWFFNSVQELGKISSNRIIAGFVTSGTGVLTDRYGLDTEVCFIEDETGGIGVVFQNSLDRGFLGTDLKYSFGDSTVRPLVLNADGSSSNVLQNDYRHNLRVGDLLIIQSGEIMFGAGTGQPRYLNQGPIVIHKVADYTIDSSLRGKSPIPFGMGTTTEEKLFRNRFGNKNLSNDISRFNSQSYGWKKEIYDSRLVLLKGKWKIMNVEVLTDPNNGTFIYQVKGPIYGRNSVFKPNSIYYLESEDGSNIIKMCISATTELAKFAVKLPSSASRPSAIGGGGGGGYLENITGILIQDTESDERVLFPRFFQDLYPDYDIQE